MKTALINTVLALLVAQGCNRQDPTTPEPVLPRAGFVLPEQPEILTPTNERSVQQLKITGTWDVRLDYAASQRKVRQPDLDMSALGNGTLEVSPSGTLKFNALDIRVRPADDKLKNKVSSGILTQLNSTLEAQWSLLGQSQRGTLYSQTGPQISGWAVGGQHGLQEIHFSRTENEWNEFLSAKQKWRLTVSLVRR